ncbi:uncharacterized [Tachysurus ichikawai]
MRVGSQNSSKWKLCVNSRRASAQGNSSVLHMRISFPCSPGSLLPLCCYLCSYTNCTSVTVDVPRSSPDLSLKELTLYPHHSTLGSLSLTKSKDSMFFVKEGCLAVHSRPD